MCVARHRLMIPGAPSPEIGESIVVEGEEARHALRVKRLGEGDQVEILNGCGLLAIGAIEAPGRRALRVTIQDVRIVEPIRPRVEIVAATPKGGRVDDLVRGLSQVGAAGWTPLDAERSVAGAGAGKLERLGAIAAESAKQCGRAWALEIADPVRFDEVVDGAVLADASGEAYTPTGEAPIRVLIGPEGGWSDTELSRAGRVCSFGVHVMRIEVAAVAAAAIVLDSERRRREQ